MGETFTLARRSSLVRGFGMTRTSWQPLKGAGSDAFLDCPPSGTALTDRITLFHDSPQGNFTCMRANRPALTLTFYQFAGGYASLAIRLGKTDLKAMAPGKQAVIRFRGTVSRPLTTFCRLNVRTPELAETLYDTVVFHRDGCEVRFELDGLRGGFEQLDSAWVDLIFSEPEMAEVEINALDIEIRPAE